MGSIEWEQYLAFIIPYNEISTNGKTKEAFTFLNQVHTRAGVGGYTGLTQSEARDKILEERRLKLYLEGHRWFDLVRTVRAISVIAQFGLKSHMTIFPIPQSQI